jgi:hypothetical protein
MLFDRGLIFETTQFSSETILMNPLTPSLGGDLNWGIPPDPCQKEFWTSFLFCIVDYLLSTYIFSIFLLSADRA